MNKSKKTNMYKTNKKYSIFPFLTSRLMLQILFCIIVINIGLKFYLFVSNLETGIIPDFERPPGVEAFLPLSALVSLKHFLLTGTINNIHPSALVLFLITCLTALIVKKGFCSYICPIGLLSEMMTKLHVMIFKRKINLPVQADLLLRSIKYILAGFFYGAFFLKCPIASIEQFIQSPYNRFADVKMLKFFTDISNTSMIVMIVLLILSIVIPYFWCRYLCPYGAVLSVLSFLSLGKIKHDASFCTDCGRCEKNCPGLIKIRQKKLVHSPECSACLTCIKNCPEKDALTFSFFPGNRAFGQPIIALILVLLFTFGIAFAKITDKWQNKVSKPEYLRYVIQDFMPWNSKGQLDSEKMQKMMQIMKNLKNQQG